MSETVYFTPNDNLDATAFRGILGWVEQGWRILSITRTIVIDSSPPQTCFVVVRFR